MEVVSDFLSEAIDSKDRIRQRQALALSERMGWRTKSLKEHQDFVIDCGGLLVDPDLALHSLFTLTWKIRFWQSFSGPLQAVLGNCHLEICDREYQKSLVIHCSTTLDVDLLYKSLNLLSQHIYHLTGHIQQVYLTVSP